MPDLQTIRARVLAYLLDDVPEVTGNIDEWINHGQRIAMEMYNFRTMMTRLSVTTVIGVRELMNIPADWKDFNKDELPFWEDETSKRQFVELAGAEDARYWYTSDPTVEKGEPRHMRREEFYDADAASAIDRIIVYPYPDGRGPEAAGEYEIKIPYYRFLADLAADGDNNWFTGNAEWFLTWYACAEGLFQLREEDRALFYSRKSGIDVTTGEPLLNRRGHYTGELGRIVQNDKRIAGRPVRTLELRLDAGYG